ncbi:nucleoside-diphosphate kinase [Candidatus Hodarchaeum mangrovi]
MVETSLMMIKPDAIQRSLIGELISRIERKGLKIIGLKMMKLSEEEIDQLYDIHIGKSFYLELKKFIGSGPVIAIAIQGENAVKIVRLLAGATNAPEANPGTIRGDYGANLTKNIVHTSDAPKRAEYELNILFNENEFVEYELINKTWIK